MMRTSWEGGFVLVPRLMSLRTAWDENGMVFELDRGEFG